jgi:hypothetical protein
MDKKLIQKSKLDIDTALAESDPLDTILSNMRERGLDSFFTHSPTKGNNGVNHRYTALTDDRKKEFLRKFAVSGRLAFSAACVGVSAANIQRERRLDPGFDIAMEEAKLYFRDLLEGEMYRRGVEGYQEEVLGGKERDTIYTVKRYSDKMMKMLANIHIPETTPTSSFRSVSVDNSSTVNVTSEQPATLPFDLEHMPADELSQLKSLLEKQKDRMDGVVDGGDVVDAEIVPNDGK